MADQVFLISANAPPNNKQPDILFSELNFLNHLFHALALSEASKPIVLL